MKKKNIPRNGLAALLRGQRRLGLQVFSHFFGCYRTETVFVFFNRQDLTNTIFVHPIIDTIVPLIREEVEHDSISWQ